MACQLESITLKPDIKQKFIIGLQGITTVITNSGLWCEAMKNSSTSYSMFCLPF